MKPLQGEYFCSLNSADKFDPELPLVKSRAHGGTLALWKVEHDPYVSIHTVSSSAFLPLIFDPPFSPLSIHIGKESSFYEELSKLSECIDELGDIYTNAPVFIRGDFNVSNKNIPRTNLLNYFCSEHMLNQVSIPHPTYHHFMGQGLSDSHLDKLLYSSFLENPESLEHVHCKLTDPLIDSHHDIIISSFKLPIVVPPEASNENVTAPTVENVREKIMWDDNGIEKYQNLVAPHLTRLQELWLDSPSKTSMSLLLESTNNLLSKCASLSNKTLQLSRSSKPSSSPVPLHIRQSKNFLLKMNSTLKQFVLRHSPVESEKVIALKSEYNVARAQHRKLLREQKAMQSSERDQLLFSNPTMIQQKIKSSKRAKAGNIQKLTVGNKTYVGASVRDGFYDSISQLKSRDDDLLQHSDQFVEFSSDYYNILELCKLGDKIPPITEKQSFDLLQKMKPIFIFFCLLFF